MVVDGVGMVVVVEGIVEGIVGGIVEGVVVGGCEPGIVGQALGQVLGIVGQVNPGVFALGFGFTGGNVLVCEGLLGVGVVGVAVGVLAGPPPTP